MSAEMSTSQRDSPWATGPTLFAAALLVISGVWVLFAGTAALTHDKIYVGTTEYLYSFNLTAWGWVHLVTGILAIAAGFAVLRDQTWAVMVGLVLACLSMVFQFLVLPLYPIWSLLVIVLDAAIIWALATDRGSRVADHG